MTHPHSQGHRQRTAQTEQTGARRRGEKDNEYNWPPRAGAPKLLIATRLVDRNHVGALTQLRD
eukprot:6340605-Lingulodinium_polyedra.AAC.1